MARIIIQLSSPLFYIFFFFFSLLSHPTMSQPQRNELMDIFCDPSNKFTETSSYQTNRNTVLSILRESSSLGSFSNVTISSSPSRSEIVLGFINNTVYGMFLCRGDINTTSCSDCVQTATIQIATNCSLNEAAIIYYEECMVRYSNKYFFSQLEIYPSIVLYALSSAPNQNRFNQTLSDKFNQLILNISSSSLVPYFVMDQEHVVQLGGSYTLESMVQCSPDLDLSNCSACLTLALSSVSTCCGIPSFAQLYTPKCLLRYQTTFVTPLPGLIFHRRTLHHR